MNSNWGGEVQDVGDFPVILFCGWELFSERIEFAAECYEIRRKAMPVCMYASCACKYACTYIGQFA